MAALVELPFDNDEGLGMTRESSGLRLVGREHLMEEAIEIKCRGRTCWKTSMEGSTDITSHLEPWSETHSGKVSTGQPRWAMPSRSYAPAKDASTTLNKLTYRPKRSR